LNYFINKLNKQGPPPNYKIQNNPTNTAPATKAPAPVATPGIKFDFY
jgi:hypothetical protein